MGVVWAALVESVTAKNPYPEFVLRYNKQGNDAFKLQVPGDNTASLSSRRMGLIQGE